MRYRIKVETDGDGVTFYYPQMKPLFGIWINIYCWANSEVKIMECWHIDKSHYVSHGYKDKTLALAVIERHKELQIKKKKTVKYLKVK